MILHQPCFDQSDSVACAYPLVKAFALRYAGKYTKICVVLHAVSSASLPGRCLMAANNHQTYIYVGLAGEGQYMAEGGLYRYAESTGEWQSMTQRTATHPAGAGLTDPSGQPCGAVRRYAVRTVSQ